MKNTFLYINDKSVKRKTFIVLYILLFLFLVTSTFTFMYPLSYFMFFCAHTQTHEQHCVHYGSKKKCMHNNNTLFMRNFYVYIFDFTANTKLTSPIPSNTAVTTSPG